MSLHVHWFRNDLRVADNPALRRATEGATRLLTVYVHDPRQDEKTAWGFVRRGAARCRGLRLALNELDAVLQDRGNRLLELTGRPEEVLPELVAALGAGRITAERIEAPEERAMDAALRDRGVPLESVWQSSLLEPDALPYDLTALPQVFNAFRRSVQKRGLPIRPVVATPRRLPPSIDPGELPARLVAGAGALMQAEAPGCPVAPTGTVAAQAQLAGYMASNRPALYKQTRNGLIGKDYSTRLSVFLALGTLSASMVHEALLAHEQREGPSAGSDWIRFELLWRDYFRFLHAQHGRRLYRAGGLCGAPVPPHDPAAFRRWCAGRTGEPFIDAGMRELYTTGFLSNRMRQNVASYLVNDLGCDWRAGAAWFESRLIDFDVCSNQGNWLYLAGRGTDPRGQRRFDPVRQAGMYDRNGDYRRLWGRAPAGECRFRGRA
ncbi:MAG: DASH family cryptochrome [Halothiobacillaceae bacterium]